MVTLLFLLQSKTSDKKQNIYISFAKNKDICLVSSLKEWIEKAEIKEEAVFWSLLKGDKISNLLRGHTVSEIIKLHFRNEYLGHSAKRGLVTASAEKGMLIHMIKKT